MPAPLTPPPPDVLARLTALDAALRAAGHLGDPPAPIMCLRLVAGPGVTVTWWADPDPAAAAAVAAWDWTPPTAAQKLQAVRDAAAAAIAATADESAQRDRAVTLAGLDEVNALRDWLTQFRAAVAASTSLADLKARVAALPATPQRSGDQAKAAVAGKIPGGGAD